MIICLLRVKCLSIYIPKKFTLPCHVYHFFIIYCNTVVYLVFTTWGLNMKSKFLIFKEKLLAQSQSYKCFSSRFILLIEVLISIYGYDW